jgi:hypothetical protein
MRFNHPAPHRLLGAATLVAALLLAASPAAAQRRPTIARRGAPGAPVVPTADASITLGSAQ